MKLSIASAPLAALLTMTAVSSVSQAQIPDAIRETDGDYAVLREARRGRCERAAAKEVMLAECRQFVAEQRFAAERRAKKSARVRHDATGSDKAPR